jgi:ABC-type multidrug transport system fused ATPase/permease subunit
VYPRVRGEIEFRNVGFGYAGGGPEILRDVTFHIRPGMRVAIIGPEGSGKTALLNLLTRLHDPSEGIILLDSKELYLYPAASLRRQFSIVPRQPAILSGTVADNIASPRFADSAACSRFSRQEIVRAAMMANAHSFIEALPQGYETPVGYDGFVLSALQRQKLAIARAFLEDAPILVFDDTSGILDGAPDEADRAVLDNLMRGRTTFLIARRLSTLEHCDVALVLQNGSLCAIAGSDADLSARRRTIPPQSAAGGFAPRPFLVHSRLAGGHD